MTQLAADDFNRANGAIGSNWALPTSFIGASQIAATIVSNEAKEATSASVAPMQYTATAAPADQYAEMTIGSVVSTTTDEGVGPAVRCASADGAMYFGQTNTVQTRLYKHTGAGTFTQLGADGAACATGDVLRIEAVGTSITVKKNGTTIVGPITDAAFATGNAGFWASFTGGGTINDWAMGNFLTATATTILMAQACL